MTWSPDTFRNQPSFRRCQRLPEKFGVPFEWNSFASAYPMPPGAHLQAKVSVLTPERGRLAIETLTL
jgi:hypothetical protein